MLAEEKANSLKEGLLSDTAPHEINSQAETASTASEREIETGLKLKSNRCKAIIFINLYSLILFAYLACTKHATTTLGVNTLDLCLVRGLVLLIGGFIISRISSATLYIEKQDKCKVIAFTLAGSFGIIFLLLGVTMVPLLVQSTLFNTAPFWASLLGCFFLNESLTRIEIVALFLSFAGVVLVAVSSRLDETEDDEITVNVEGES